MELIFVGLIILYIAFFSNPPPQHLVNLLSNPFAKLVALVAIVFVAMKSPMVGLFLGIAYISTPTTFEYFEGKDKEDEDDSDKIKKTPIDMEAIKKMADVLGKSGSLPTTTEKSDTKPPPSTETVKPHDDAKSTEKFTVF